MGTMKQVWYSVYVKTRPPAGTDIGTFRKMASFRMRIDADQYSDRLRSANPTWLVIIKETLQ